MPDTFDLFNFLFGSAVYTKPAQLRADDLLIRGRAEQSLATAATALRDVSAKYQKEMVPAPSRDHPFADPQVMAPMRKADQIRSAVNQAMDAIRNAEMPYSDDVWNRHRKPNELMQLLQATDRQMIYACDRAEKAVSDLSPMTLAAYDWNPLESALQEIRTAVTERVKLTRLNQ